MQFSTGGLNSPRRGDSSGTNFHFYCFFFDLCGKQKFSRNFRFFHEIINFNNDTKFTWWNGLSRDKGRDQWETYVASDSLRRFDFSDFLRYFFAAFHRVLFFFLLSKCHLQNVFGIFIVFRLCLLFERGEEKKNEIDNNFVPLKPLKMT